MSASGSLAGPLRSLLLTTMAREHEDALARAEAENWGYRRFLSYLVENEVNERLRRRIDRTLKEQIIHGHIYRNRAELAAAVTAFVATYNRAWRLEKLRYKSPLEARLAYQSASLLAA